MAVGKEIKVTMTLQSAGFTAGAKAASEGAQVLGTALMDVSGITDRFEAAFGKLASPLESSQRLIKAVTGQLDQLLGLTRSSAAGIDSIAGSMDRLSRQGTSATAALSAAGDRATKTAVAIAQMKPSLAAAAQGFKDLEKAESSQISGSKNSATAAIEFRQRKLQEQLRLNDQELAQQALQHKRYLDAERNFQGQAMAAELEAGRLQRSKRAGSGPSSRYQLSLVPQFEESQSIAAAQAAATKGRLIDLERQSAQLKEQLVTERQQLEIETRRATIQDINTFAGRKNNEAVAMAVAAAQRRAKAEKDADAEIQESARRTAAEQTRVSKEAAAAQKAQAASVSQTWKALAELWVGSKIEQGLKKSASAADDYQRVVERVDSIGLNGAQGKQNILDISKAVEKSNRNLSPTEALKLTMSNVAGTVSTDKETLTAIVPEIAKLITVIERQYPEQAHNIENFGRNLIGTMESMGITNDVPKMLSTLDTVARAMMLTQGKITTTDLEMMMRRVGLGNTMLKGQDALLYDIAAANQMKTMGGGGGGGQGGVSTFATQQRGMEKLVQGGTRETMRGLQNLLEFGLVDKQQLLQANHGKIGRNYVPVPLIGADEAADNITLWTINMAKAVKKKLAALPLTDTRFFDAGADRTDDKVLSRGFQRFANQTFANSNTAQFAGGLAPAGSNERIQKEVDASKQAPKFNTTAYEEAVKSYGFAVKEAKASQERFEIEIGTILIPSLTKALQLVSDIFDFMAKFTADNPMIGTILTVGTAATGAAVGVAGLMGILGAGGGLTGLLKAVGAAATSTFPTLTAGATAAGEAAAVAGVGGFARFATFLLKLTGWMASAAFAGAVGYAIGTWINDADAGGITVGAVIKNRITEMVVAVQDIMHGVVKAWDATVNYLRNRWIDLKQFFGTDVVADRANVEYDKARQKIENEAYDKQRQINLGSRIAGGRFGAGGGGFFGTTSTPIGVSQGDLRSLEQATAANHGLAKAIEEVGKAKTNAGVGKSGTGSKRPKRAPVGSASNILTPEEMGKKAKKATKDPIVREDPLKAAVVEEQNQLNKAQIQLKDLELRREAVVDLHEIAKSKIMADLAAGKFDPGHDTKKRPSATDPKITEAIDVQENFLLAEQQKKGLTFANERLAASEVEADAAMERVAGNGAAKQSEAYRALERDMARLEERNKFMKGFAPYDAVKSEAFFNRAVGDAGNFAAELKDRNKSDAAKYGLTEQDRVQATLDSGANEKERNVYARRKQTLDEEFDLFKANAQKQLDLDRSTGADREALVKSVNDRLLNAQTKYNATSGALDAQQALAVKNQQLELERAFESPMTALARKWKDTYQGLRELQTGWADGFVNTLVDGLSKGKFAFTDFAKSVLTDILKLKLKETLADPLTTIINGATDFLRINLFQAPPVQGTPSNPANDTHELTKMTQRALDATDGLESVGKSAAEEAVKSASSMSATEAQTFAVHQSTIAATSLAPSLEALTGASYEAARAMQSIGGGNFGSGLASGLSGDAAAAAGLADVGSGVGGMSFADALAAGITPLANGGLMTKHGPMQLRRYATGGVANRPQLAMYGEAGPEAYVPLPDGRSIPVTMQGGGAAPEITINMINQSGTPVAAQQGQVRFDGKQAVLDIVLTASNQPGPFRDGMKGAMR